MKCFLAAAGEAKAVSYSPDGSKIAWQDGEGVKVAGAPDFGQPNGAGDTCTLSSPPALISATGVDPNFGGADVAAIAAARGGGAGGGGGQSPAPGAKPSIKLAVPAKIKLAKRVAVRVTVPGAGSVSARLVRGARAVASGSARSARAGEVRVKLKLRKGVKPRKLRGKRLALRVSWTGAAGGSAVATAKVKVR
jgi:hypothetical protein